MSLLILAISLFAGQAPLPDGENPLGRPAMQAYSSHGTKFSKITVDGQDFKEAFDINIVKKPSKVHLANLNASNALPVKKGDVLFMRWSGRSLMDGADGKGQLFVQSSKDWSKALANQEFVLTKDWQTWTVFFKAPRDYEARTLYFNFLLGHQAQRIAMGNLAAVNCGGEKSLDELQSSARPRTVGSDFEGEFVPVKVESEKSNIGGYLPSDWEDDSRWADVDVEYSKATDNPFAGEGALRVTASEIRDGRVQLRIPTLPVSTQWFTKASLSLRSPGSMAVKFGIRKKSSPYNYYGERSVTALPEWSRHELIVPPVVNDPQACMMVELSIPGVLELDAVKIEYISPEEMAGSADLSGNLLTLSSFPEGITAPWAPFHEPYHPENYAVDKETEGPTGQPALKITTASRSPNQDVAALLCPFVALGDRYYTLSLWAKAEEAGHQINLRFGPPSESLWHEPYQKTITLGTRWRRFHHTVKLPYSPDGFYLIQVMNWGPKGVFWVDGVQLEARPSMSDFKRSGKGHVEVALNTPVSYGLIEEGGRFEISATAFGEIEPGMLLKTELYDVHGKSYQLPDRELGGETTQHFKFALPEIGQPPLGSYRLEAVVLGKNGEAVSKTGELLLHRVRRPKYHDQFRPDSPFGVHLTPNSEMPGVMRKLGFTWVRQFGMGWERVEREKGQWNFSGMTETVRMINDAKLCLSAILGGIPVWARSWVLPSPSPKGYNNWHANNVPPKPENMNDWQEYCRRMSEHYAETVHAWETWNEPFLPGFLNQGWQDGRYIHPEPEVFMEIHRTAYDGLKEGNPDARVVFNGGAHYHAPADEWTKRLYEMGIFDLVDAVSYHGYYASGIGYPGDVIHRATEANSNPNDPTMEVWNTEGGHGPADMHNFYRYIPPFGKSDREEHWADYMVRFWVSTLASGADKFFLYTNHGWGTWRNDYYTMNVDGRLSPSLVSVSNLAWHLEGRKYSGKEELKPGLYAYFFEGEGGCVAVVLSKGIARMELASLDEGVKIRDVFGNGLSLPVKLGDVAVFFDGPGMNAARMAAALRGEKAKQVTVVEKEVKKDKKEPAGAAEEKGFFSRMWDAIF